VLTRQGNFVLLARARSVMNGGDWGIKKGRREKGGKVGQKGLGKKKGVKALPPIRPFIKRGQGGHNGSFVRLGCFWGIITVNVRSPFHRWGSVWKQDLFGGYTKQKDGNREKKKIAYSREEVRPKGQKKRGKRQGIT